MIPTVPIEPLVLRQFGPHHDDLWTTLCDLPALPAFLATLAKLGFKSAE